MESIKMKVFKDNNNFSILEGVPKTNNNENGVYNMTKLNNNNSNNNNGGKLAVSDNKVEEVASTTATPITSTSTPVEDKKVEAKTDVATDAKDKVENAEVSKPEVEVKPKEDKVDDVKDDKPEVIENDSTDEDEDEEEITEEKVVEKAVRTTRLSSSRIDKTFKFLFKNRNKLKFDLAIQRKEVWTQNQKDGLINSIIYGYPVPPVMVAESEDGNFWFLDGKQRGTTVVSFIAGEWALSKKAEPILGVDVAGKKFSELPHEFQEYIEDETITLIRLKGLSDEERDEMFVRWNSGSALSKIELTRAKHSALISQINEISSHEFFSSDIAMTEKGRNRFQDQEVVMQIAMLLERGRDGIKGFGAKEIDEYVLEMKNEDKILTKALMTRIKSISNFMNMVSSELDPKQKKKILKKANTPIVFYQASKVIDEKIKPNIYAEFLIKFLDEEYDIESDYGQSLQSGVSKRENVVIRLNEIELAFNEFVLELKKTLDEKEIYKSKK